MKKYCSAVLLSAAVLGVAAEENLALKKPVTASSVERKTLEPELAVDGNLKTRQKGRASGDPLGESLWKTL